MKIYKEYFLPNQREPENREKGPELEIKFLFSAHATAEDFKDFEFEFDKADVLVPELVGWSEETLQYLRKLAAENKPIAKVSNFSMATGEILKSISGSHKAIELVDIPKGNYIDNMQSEARKIGQESLNLAEFNEMISGLKSFLIKFSEAQKLRDKYIVSQIKTLKDKIIKDYPALAKRDKLNILITMGSFHTDVYRQTKEDFKSTQELNTVTLVYDNITGVLQKLQHIEYPKIDDITDIEVARCWLSSVMAEEIFSPTKNTAKFSEYLWLASRQFLLEEIKDLFKKKNSGQHCIKEALERKNFPVPIVCLMSDERFDKFLDTCRKCGQNEI